MEETLVASKRPRLSSLEFPAQLVLEQPEEETAEARNHARGEREMVELPKPFARLLPTCLKLSLSFPAEPKIMWTFGRAYFSQEPWASEFPGFNSDLKATHVQLSLSKKWCWTSPTCEV